MNSKLKAVALLARCLTTYVKIHIAYAISDALLSIGFMAIRSSNKWSNKGNSYLWRI